MNGKFEKEKEVLRTWVDIDTKATARNLRLLRKEVGPKVRTLAVVKSNAYGHGLVEWSKTVERMGMDWLGVDSFVEGETLRKAGVRIPVLVLGYTLPALLLPARKAGITLTLSDFAQLDALGALPRSKTPLRVHLKVDTGMHRQGFQLSDKERLLPLLSQALTKGGFVVEGLYTHFAKTKDPHDRDAFHRQLHEFETWQAALLSIGIHPLTHASATGGALLFPKAHFDMVRVGIGMYGLWPSGETQRHRGKTVTLTPALSWRAMVSEVKVVKKGERIGYDLTELLLRDTTIAIIPVGYWHGYPRALSGKGRVLIHGCSARVLGRVSMNMIVVDVTDIPRVRVGDVATLIGKDKKETILAGELATLSGTTHYEILTRMNPLMKKFYQ